MGVSIQRPVCFVKGRKFSMQDKGKRDRTKKRKQALISLFNLLNRMGKVVVAMFTIFALLMGAPMDADAARYPPSNTRHNHSQTHDYHAKN